MIAAFKRQFHQPEGWMGWIVGYIMQITKRERNLWAAELLNLKPSDAVLEIGFGPGLALEQAAKTARYVAGVDPSHVMLTQAKRRNAKAIRSGKVDVRLGGVENLPFSDDTFDKAFAVNTFHHWQDQKAGLAEIQRVLKPGGMCILIAQPVPGAQPVPAETIADKNAQYLRDAGFQDVTTKIKVTDDSYVTAAIGFNN